MTNEKKIPHPLTFAHGELAIMMQSLGAGANPRNWPEQACRVDREMSKLMENKVALEQQLDEALAKLKSYESHGTTDYVQVGNTVYVVGKSIATEINCLREKLKASEEARSTLERRLKTRLDNDQEVAELKFRVDNQKLTIERYQQETEKQAKTINEQAAISFRQHEAIERAQSEAKTHAENYVRAKDEVRQLKERLERERQRNRDEVDRLKAEHYREKELDRAVKTLSEKFVAPADGLCIGGPAHGQRVVSNNGNRHRTVVMLPPPTLNRDWHSYAGTDGMRYAVRSTSVVGMGAEVAL